MSAARLRIVARLGGASSELSPFVIGSLLVHGGFVVALLLVPYFKPDRPFPEAPLVVDLVATPGPQRPRVSPPSPPAAPPPKAPPPKAASVETRKPPPVEPLPEKIEPVKNPKKEPEPRPSQTAQGSPPTDPAPGEAAEGIVADDGGSSITPLEGGDVEFAWYRSAVTAALYGRWRRPLLERLVEPIEVQVSFEIQRDGSIRNFQIDQSSGVTTLDRSAHRAVSEASPLPQLPPNWRGSVLPATFIFRLHPE